MGCCWSHLGGEGSERSSLKQARSDITFSHVGGVGTAVSIAGNSVHTHIVASDDAYANGLMRTKSGGSGDNAGCRAFVYPKQPPIRTTKLESGPTSSVALICHLGLQGGSSQNESKINHLFEKYMDKGVNADDEGVIVADGIIRFCSDLKVSPEDFIVLVLAWKFEAQQMCRFTRSEFCGGFRRLKIDSIRSLQSKLKDVESEVLNDDFKFKELYRFAFGFALDSDLNQRVLAVETACSLWKVVFSRNAPLLLDSWIAFLQSKQCHSKSISCDTWNMFLNFVTFITSDLANYDPEEAWPSLIDDFVEHELETNRSFRLSTQSQNSNGPVSELRSQLPLRGSFNERSSFRETGRKPKQAW